MIKLPKYKTLDVEQSDGWMTIWFNRPEVRNALSQEMTAELSHIFEALKETRKVRGVTLRGRGGTFCAGGDLKGFKTDFHGGAQAANDVARSNRVAGKMLDLVNETPQVVAVLVEGAAMAGGFGIVCCADVVVVTEDAKFAMTETSIGIPPAQIAPFVVGRLGLRNARRLMLTAGRLNGREAGQIGLADFVARDASHMNEIEEDVRKQVRKCAPDANAVTKEILLATRYLDRPAMIELAGDGFAKCMLSEEGKEGVASFLEKRRPDWVGNLAKKGA